MAMIITPSKYNALKPCPFCGSDEVVYEQYVHLNGQQRWRVFCCGCMAGVDTGRAQSQSAVAEIWNHRVPVEAKDE